MVTGAFFPQDLAKSKSPYLALFGPLLKELTLKLIQARMAQKPLLLVEVTAFLAVSSCFMFFLFLKVPVLLSTLGMCCMQLLTGLKLFESLTESFLPGAVLAYGEVFYSSRAGLLGPPAPGRVHVALKVRGFAPVRVCHLVVHLQRHAG